MTTTLLQQAHDALLSARHAIRNLLQSKGPADRPKWLEVSDLTDAVRGQIEEAMAQPEPEPICYTDPLYLRVKQIGGFACQYEPFEVFTTPLYNAPPAQPAPVPPGWQRWAIEFADERDFCRFASLLIGAVYVNGSDAMERFHDGTLRGERTHGKVTASAVAAPKAAPRRCPYCDDTGHVHTLTGEWRGLCVCEAGEALKAVPPEAPCGNRDYCGRHPFCGCGAPDNGLPERDSSKPAEQQGLFRKFTVSRTDNSDRVGGRHYGCEYFVLDINHDKAAPVALAAYADAIEATHPVLATDMRERYALAAALKAVPVPTFSPSGPNLWRNAAHGIVEASHV